MKWLVLIFRRKYTWNCECNDDWTKFRDKYGDIDKIDMGDQCSVCKFHKWKVI